MLYIYKYFETFSERASMYTSALKHSKRETKHLWGDFFYPSKWHALYVQALWNILGKGLLEFRAWHGGLDYNVFEDWL